MDSDLNKYNNSSGYHPQTKLPNSGAVFYLGLISLIFCWFYGFLSIILSIIVLVISPAAEKEYQRTPHVYSASSYQSLKLGRLFAIIGLCLGIVSLIFSLIWIFLFGALMFNIFDLGI